MKKLTALLLFSFLAAASANATLFWYEGFQYKNGAIITNSIIGPGTNALWTRESGSAVPSDLLVLNSNLQVAATGGSLITRQDDCDRLFIETSGNITGSPFLVLCQLHRHLHQSPQWGWKLLCLLL